MRLSKVRISGFRSVCPYTEAKFDKPDKGTPKVVDIRWCEAPFAFELRRDSRDYDLTGIAGPNNAGKSNVLRALLLFFSNLNSDETSVRIDPVADFHCCGPGESESGKRTICIEMVFQLAAPEEVSDLQDYLIQNEDTTDETNRLLCLGCLWEFDGSAHWYVRTDLDESAVDEIAANLKSGALKQIVAHMPRFYWLPTGADTSKEQQVKGSKYLKRLVDDIVKDIKALQQIGDKDVAGLQKDEKALHKQLAQTQKCLQSLRDNLDKLQQLPSALNELAGLLVSYMQPIMPGMKAWFEYTSALPTDYWKWLNVSMIRLDDGWPTSITEKGHGAQRTFAIALLQAYAAHRAQSHPSIIAIEEPEIYMHPHIARSLANTLKNLAKDAQVVFSTHSPVFVQTLEWENLVLVRKTDGGSRPKQIPSDILSLSQREVIKRNIDATKCELFFARHVVLVEGATERFALPGFVRTLRQDPDNSLKFDLDEMGISVLDVGGATKLAPFLTLLHAFGITASILVDADAIGVAASQMQSCGLLSADEIDIFNGLGNDTDARRTWLREQGCFVLDTHFEQDIAACLCDERVWEIVNMARCRKGKRPIPPIPFPGETAAQVEQMVNEWLNRLRRGIRATTARDRRDELRTMVVPPAATQAWLKAIAEQLITSGSWAANSREKWLAQRLSREGKPLVGLILGESLTSEEIQGFHGLVPLINRLSDFAPDKEQ